MAWEQAATVASTFASLLLGYLIHRIGKVEANTNRQLDRIEEKLDKKVDKEDCIRAQAECPYRNGLRRAEKEDSELWQALERHSHTGLPSDSRVVR